MKNCFTCKHKKPLILFKKNRMKYQLKSDFGRCVECRSCSVKRFIKQKGKIVKYNFNIKKFEILELKINLINIINQYV
jgi:DNA-directed RNA polymerase subunit RPC12/RpoP